MLRASIRRGENLRSGRPKRSETVRPRKWGAVRRGDLI